MAPEDRGTICTGRMVDAVRLNLPSLCAVLRSRTWTGRFCCGGPTLCCTLHEVLCPSLQAPGMSFAGVTSAARGAGVIHPWPPLVPAPFGCPSGGEGRGRLKHLPSTAWGRMNQFKPGVAAVRSHLKLMCVGLAPWVSSLGPCLPGLPSPRQQHLEETACPFGPKRAML